MKALFRSTRCTACAMALALSFGALPAWSQPSTDFDIYLFDIHTGAVTQVTGIPDAGEFNPSFSNNGKYIVHDVVTATSHDLFLTHIPTRTSTPLAGGDGGNDGSWSPNGNQIAFDRAPVGDPSLYVVPATGGTRTLVRTDAVDPDWSQNSARLVFVDVTDGSVRTVDTGGGTETVVAASGANPVWSPNGKYIAYVDGGDLYRIRVDGDGNPLGSAEPITSDAAQDGQPSWSNNSRTLVFHSDRNGDFDLWTVPASGGAPTFLTGQPGNGDFDPSYSKDGRLVAYSGFTPPPVAGAAVAAKTVFGLETSSRPNPFNPATVISFTLPEASPVTVKIYDLTGREVAVLLSESLEAGVHEVRWEAGRRPSGLYLYRIEAGPLSATRSLLFIK